MSQAGSGSFLLITTKRRAIVALVVAASFVFSHFWVSKKYQHLDEMHLTSWRAVVDHWPTAALDAYLICLFGWLVIWILLRATGAERVCLGTFVLVAISSPVRNFLPVNWAASIRDAGELLDLVMVIAAVSLLRNLVLQANSSAELPPS